MDMTQGWILRRNYNRFPYVVMFICDLGKATVRLEECIIEVGKMATTPSYYHLVSSDI